MNRIRYGFVLVLFGFAHPLFGMLEGTFLYFPSHSSAAPGLSEWREGGELLGYASPVPSPRMVWLMCHGNAGQASQRGYIRSCLPGTDAVYILEYPGYGARPGRPSMATINRAAEEAYRALRRKYPGLAVGVIGESLGSGPASFVCSRAEPPERLVLIVPFDTLQSVAHEQFPFLPVRLLMRDKWDNVSALAHYPGRVEIFGAADDTIIPVRHAKKLAGSLRGATYHEMPSGHNDWSALGQMKIEP